MDISSTEKSRERPWLTQFNGHDTHHVGHGSPPHAWPWRAAWHAGAPLLEGARGEGGLRRVGGRPVGLVMGWRGSIVENDEDGWLTWTKGETGGLMMLINLNGYTIITFLKLENISHLQWLASNGWDWKPSKFGGWLLGAPQHLRHQEECTRMAFVHIPHLESNMTKVLALLDQESWEAWQHGDLMLYDWSAWMFDEALKVGPSKLQIIWSWTSSIYIIASNNEFEWCVALLHTQQHWEHFQI